MSPFPGYQNVTRETTPAVPMHFSIWLHERCGALILLPPQHDTVCFEPGAYWAEQHSNVRITSSTKAPGRPKPQRIIHHGEEVHEDVRGDQPGDSGSGAV